MDDPRVNRAFRRKALAVAGNEISSHLCLCLHVDMLWRCGLLALWDPRG